MKALQELKCLKHSNSWIRSPALWILNTPAGSLVKARWSPVNSVLHGEACMLRHRFPRRSRAYQRAA